MQGEPPRVLRPVSFDSIVIDEAAQASEPDIVLPATSASCRVIVVGDHKQLGADGFEALIYDLIDLLGVWRFDSEKSMREVFSDGSTHPVNLGGFLDKLLNLPWCASVIYPL